VTGYAGVAAEREPLPAEQCERVRLRFAIRRSGSEPDPDNGLPRSSGDPPTGIPSG